MTRLQRTTDRGSPRCGIGSDTGWPSECSGTSTFCRSVACNLRRRGCCPSGIAQMPLANVSTWSMAAAHIYRRTATKPPVDRSLRVTSVGRQISNPCDWIRCIAVLVPVIYQPYPKSCRKTARNVETPQNPKRALGRMNAGGLGRTGYQLGKVVINQRSSHS